MSVVVLPALPFTTARFAESFPGTLSLQPATAAALVADLAASLARHGFAILVIANAHLDPAHLASLETAAEHIRRELELPVAFPNLTLKPWAPRLSEEF